MKTSSGPHTQPPEGRAIYDFGEFRLDAGQRLLTSRDGRVLPLVSRAFDTLLYLIERPGELVSKDVLLKAVWPRTIVEENNLNQSIAAIRVHSANAPASTNTSSRSPAGVSSSSRG